MSELVVASSTEVSRRLSPICQPGYRKGCGSRGWQRARMRSMRRGRTQRRLSMANQAQVSACRECGREFPDLPLAWRRREIVCGPCSVKPKCSAPEPCPTPDLCADFEGCCWPEWTESDGNG